MVQPWGSWIPRTPKGRFEEENNNFSKNKSIGLQLQTNRQSEFIFALGNFR